MRSTILELNFFQISDLLDEQQHINRQRRTTRAYLVLLAAFVSIIVFHKFIGTERYTETVRYPSELTYFQLQSTYPSSLRCYCTQLSIDYDSFLRIQTVYHPVCSSDFMSSAWQDLIRANPPPDFYSPLDLRRIGVASFRLLATFCEMASKTINDSRGPFLRQKFITTEVTPKDIFERQVDTIVNDWQNVMNSDFLRSYELFRTTWLGNKLMSNHFNVILLSLQPGYVIVTTTSTTGSMISSMPCYCALSALCFSPMILYPNETSSIMFPNFNTGCFPIATLLLSSFELFYDQSFMDQIMFYLVNNSIDFRPRVLNITANDRPDELIGDVANRLFVNQWIVNISFHDYFSKCSPSSCTYETQRRPTVLAMIIIAIGTFGGLSTALRILFHILLRMMNACDMHLSTRAIRIWFVRFTDRRHLSHRLNILLIGTSLVALYFTSAFTQYRQVDEIARNPSLEEHEQLLHRYPNGTLRCSCSQSSITYKSFMNISVTQYHQICASRFITYEWMATYIQLMGVSIMGPSPFSQAITTYFTLISNLCQLSQTTVNNSISEFLARILLQTEVNPSRTQFQAIIESMIRQFQLNIALPFLQTLELLREIIHINTLMPAYRSNWLYPMLNLSTDDLIPHGFKTVTTPVRYGSCDCALSKDCTQPASNQNGSILPGLMVGCYPVEALLKSTLKCFYSLHCFEKIILGQTISVDDTLTVLNDSNPSCFNSSMSFELILSQLFIEEWSHEISYEKYYRACAASSCFYSYERSAPMIDILTYILGLYGGIVIVVKSIVVPLVIHVSYYIRRSPDRTVPLNT